MKNHFISAVRTIIHDRYLTVLLGTFFLLSLIIVVFIGFSIKPSELQVVVHYSSYGATNFYRDKWYYLITFAVSVLIFALIHGVLTYKLLQAKGRAAAIAFTWLGIVISVIAAILFYQVLKIASLS